MYMYVHKPVCVPCEKILVLIVLFVITIGHLVSLFVYNNPVVLFICRQL